MIVWLLALRADCLSPSVRFLVLIHVRGSIYPRAIVRLQRFRALKWSHDLLWNWTRDLPACSVVPQPTTLLRGKDIIKSTYDEGGHFVGRRSSLWFTIFRGSRPMLEEGCHSVGLEQKLSPPPPPTPFRQKREMKPLRFTAALSPTLCPDALCRSEGRGCGSIPPQPDISARYWTGHRMCQKEMHADSF
jgi:hypothetical protein